VLLIFILVLLVPSRKVVVGVSGSSAGCFRRVRCRKKAAGGRVSRAGNILLKVLVGGLLEQAQFQM